MNIFLLILIILLSIILFFSLLVAILYFIILPKFIVNKLRSGEDVVSNPENFDEVLEQVIITKDLEYKSSSTNNTYDLYQPKNAKDTPLVIWVHGGFFVAGDKRGVLNVCATLASRGYSVAAINYLHAPENKYLNIIKQIDEFILNIDNISNIDKSKIILAGDSAGGQLICQYTTALYNEELQNDMHFVPSLNKDSLIATLLVCAPIDLAMMHGKIKKLDLLLPLLGKVLYGNYKFYSNYKYKYVKLYNYLTNKMPKMILTDGNSYSFEKQNRMLGEKLQSLGVDVEEIYFDKDIEVVNHEYLFDLKLKTAQNALNEIINILDKTI